MKLIYQWFCEAILLKIKFILVNLYQIISSKFGIFLNDGRNIDPILIIWLLLTATRRVLVVAPGRRYRRHSIAVGFNYFDELLIYFLVEV